MPQRCSQKDAERIQRLIEQCKAKVQYQTREGARRYAEVADAKYRCKNRIYQCPYCTMWHLTTEKP